MTTTIMIIILGIDPNLILAAKNEKYDATAQSSAVVLPKENRQEIITTKR